MKQTIKRNQEYSDAIDKKAEFESKGFVFEIHWSFARVYLGEKTILDYDKKLPFCPVQYKRDELYRENVVRAVHAVEDFIALAKSLFEDV